MEYPFSSLGAWRPLKTFPLIHKRVAHKKYFKFCEAISIQANAGGVIIGCLAKSFCIEDSTRRKNFNLLAFFRTTLYSHKKKL